ncbi:GATA binding protein 1a [Lates japonicus]|uniref:GATA binding protein 1a n=1 Tax=Lates japonicus TaxID=270547 RepID=A0AAD3RAT9_LATJO|nr:GATA binding protein 1a [Lates japonicus]
MDYTGLPSFSNPSHGRAPSTYRLARLGRCSPPRASSVTSAAGRASQSLPRLTLQPPVSTWAVLSTRPAASTHPNFPLHSRVTSSSPRPEMDTPLQAEGRESPTAKEALRQAPEPLTESGQKRQL